MDPKKLLRFANSFYSMAMSEELPENSKELTTILNNLEKLETYSARKKYAEKNLKHLSSGSARIVYLTPEHTIVKLAKNDKGIAQNRAEANPKMNSKYLNKIIKSAKNNSWLETYYLDKVTTKQFEELTDLDFNDFGECIQFALKDVSGSSKEKPKNYDDIKNNDFFKEMIRIGKQFKLLPGDMARISSWGEKDKNPILIDAGLTREIFDQFYESTS